MTEYICAICKLKQYRVHESITQRLEQTPEVESNRGLPDCSTEGCKRKATLIKNANKPEEVS
jgi:hypothetical protein